MPLLSLSTLAARSAMERLPELWVPFPKESDKSPLNASLFGVGGSIGLLLGLRFARLVIPGLFVREFELEVGFDAAKSVKRSFWGRVG